VDPFAAEPAGQDPGTVLELVGRTGVAEAGAPPVKSLVLVEFFVPLRPRTKGSLKPVLTKGGRIFLKEQITEGPIWRARCAYEAQQALAALEGETGVRWPYAAPVSVTAVFRFRRRPGDDRPLPTSRYYGDADKLVRNAWDALVDAGVIKDDSLVVDFGDSCKEFAGDNEPVGAWIQVSAVLA
jgi:Holliday junction resolvase RusA-like endonuclease